MTRINDPRLTGARDDFVRRHSAFVSSEEGAVTLPFLIWLPLVIFLFFMILDFSYAFTVNASMWQQARVAARGMSMYSINAPEAEDFIRKGLSWSKKDFDVEIAQDRETVTVIVSTPFANSGIINSTLNAMPGNWMTRVTMLKEPI